MLYTDVKLTLKYCQKMFHSLSPLIESENLPESKKKVTY